ncbi:MAG TPA: response regulator [Planctomycetota bacterium]|jgi:DNA-binding response OmpR family regulator|nr:response regulator [Planctomycetota bacterium]
MSGKRVLVVDDEPYILRSLCYVLRKEGYDVREARTGPEALEAVRSEPPDLLFLDVMLPEVNGFDVCRQIREDVRLSGVRIVMLTARGQDHERSRAVGADLFMTKPFSPSKILDVARGLTSGGTTAGATGDHHAEPLRP